MATIPTDPLFFQQWYLRNLTLGQFDINVVDVWDDYTGAGVQVTVIDVGYDLLHADLDGNFLTNLDYDYISGDSNPDEGNGPNRHGTPVAGIIGAEEGNSYGGVGIAWDADLVAYRGNFSGYLDAAGLGDGSGNTNGNDNGSDVLSGSFSEKPNFVYMDAEVSDLQEIADYGRGGLGVSFMRSNGNQRDAAVTVEGIEATAVAESSFHTTTSVGAVRADGWVARSSTPGANLLVSAFSSNIDDSWGIFNTDRIGTAGYNNSTSANGGDFTNFSGTSASTPIVSGVVTLMMEANPDLGWRDVQEILAYSARHVGSNVGAFANTGAPVVGGITRGYEVATQTNGATWFWNDAQNWNGGGLHFSNDYGFGLVDALAAVRLAETWERQSTSHNQLIFERDMDGASVTSNITNSTTSFNVELDQDMIIDHVTVNLNFSVDDINDIDIDLVSPDGTRVQLLSNLDGASGTRGFVTNASGWDFGTPAFMGTIHEGAADPAAAGTWRLDVRNLDGAGAGAFTIIDADITFRGRELNQDALYVFTNEYSDYDGVGGHVTSFNGGTANSIFGTFNAAAVTSNTTLNFLTNAMIIDGVTASATNISRAYTGDGDDTVTGDTVTRFIHTGRGNDSVDGGSNGAGETINGGTGNDVINGGAGDDTLIDGSFGDSDGQDSLDGGADDDLIVVTWVTSGNTYEGGSGNDTIDTGDDGTGVDVDLSTASFVSFGSTFSGFENAITGAGSNELTGSNDANLLIAGRGNDDVDGQGGNDTIFGDDIPFDLLKINTADGVTDQYAQATSFDAMPTDTLTVEWLFRGTQEASSGTSFVSYAVQNSTNEFLVYAETGGNITVWINGTRTDTGVAASTVFDGEVHRMSVSLNTGAGPNGRISLYIDGVEEFRGEGASTNVANSLTDGGLFIIGQDQDLSTPGTGFDPNQVLKGAFGDVRVWSTERDQADIDADKFTQFDALDLPTRLDLVANWQLDRDTLNFTNLPGGDALTRTSAGGNTFGAESFTPDGGNDDILGGAGNDTIEGGSGNDTINGGLDDDLIIGGAGADSLDGGDQTDTLSYEGSEGGVLIFLETGTASTFSGATSDAVGDTIANFENLIGSSYADRFGGDDNDNRIEGRAGNDLIADSRGVDTLLGGDDDDTFQVQETDNEIGEIYDGGAGFDQLFVFGTGATSTFDFVDDTVVNIEKLEFLATVSPFAGGGTARFFSSQVAGFSEIEKNAGTAPAIVDIFMDGTSVDLSGITVTGFTEAESDLIKIRGDGDAETITGTQGDDSITGAGGGDSLVGSGGNDTLDGGLGTDTIIGGDNDDLLLLNGSAADRDYFSGGDGNDTLDASGSTDEGYIFDMEFQNYFRFSSPTAFGLTGLENIVGTDFADGMLGDEGDNTLIGGQGDDRIEGGFGGDSLDGGDQTDTLIYANSSGGVRINLALNTAETNSGFATSHAEGDTISNFENVIGSGFADRIDGDSGANRIEGGAGDDLIGDTAGVDTLLGGDNDDTFQVADGDNETGEIYDGGAGFNQLFVFGTGPSSIFDFTDDTVLNFDKLEFLATVSPFAGGGTARFTTAQFAGFSEIEKTFGTAPAIVDLIMSDTSFDLSGVTVTGFTAAENDRIEITGDGDSESIIGSQVDDRLDAGGGNNTVVGGNGNDTIVSTNGNDDLQGGLGSDTYVIGDFGVVTLTEVAAYGDVDTLDLTPSSDGWTSQSEDVLVSGLASISAMSPGNGLGDIEIIIGSDHADNLIVDGLLHELDLGGGNDTARLLDMLPAQLQDLDGGDGTDTLDLASLSGGYNYRIIDLDGGQLFGNEGGIFYQVAEIAGFENVVGDDGFNAITGSDADGNDLSGNGGNDDIAGLGGNDTLRGGADNDLLNGGEGADSLLGGTGDDTLIGGAGADMLDGGADVDTAVYSLSSSFVIVRLFDGLALGGDAAGDVLTSIENLVGSTFGDSLIGDFDEDNRLDGGDGNDNLRGLSGNDTLLGGAGADTVDGGDDIDTASYATSADRVIVRLWNGTALGGDAAGDTLTSIENLTGSDYNDTLIGEFDEGNVLAGGNGDDNLRGLSGDDTLMGGAGADTLDGGDETDTASYATSMDRVIVRLWNGTALGGDAAGDTLISIENLTGSAHDDSLIGAFDEGNVLDGGDGDDNLRGLSGNDTLLGGIGADTIDGGDDIDTASYATSGSFVIVRLFDGLTLGGDAAGDTLIGIENLIGSDHDDSLIGAFNEGNLLGGGAGNDNLRGLSGDDTLLGGIGADTLDGGTGSDTASYATSDSRVIVRLTDGLALGGDAVGDTLISIENLTGSAHDDTLIGAFAAGNVLDGGNGHDDLRGLSGDDTLLGGEGNDTLEGDEGADVMDGGADMDTASYATSTSFVIVRLTDGLALGGDAVGDTFTSIENLAGSDHDDTLIGAFNEGNALNGGDGDDLLRGLSGDDTLLGGAGADELDGGDDIDTASYAGSGSFVIVRLTDGLALGGDAVGDTITGIENLVGSDHDDTLIGAFNEGNVLDGADGNDLLRGLSGADTLIGGAGDDMLEGGGADGDADVFVFVPGAGADTVTDFADNEDRLEFGGGLTSLADLTFAQQAADVLITYGISDSVLVEGITLASLTDDVVFDLMA